VKSAYELAMERLEKESGPSRKLSGKQKAEIATIEKKYEAKIAETRLSYDARMGGAPDFEALNALKMEMAGKVAALEEQRDAEKDRLWNAE
jgi:hypothetical protein